MPVVSICSQIKLYFILLFCLCSNIAFCDDVLTKKEESYSEDIVFIKKFAQENKIDSVSSFLENLYRQKNKFPKKYQVNDEFHAIYNSFGSKISSGKANYENPRILIEFNNSILAFTGNPDNVYTDKYIEVISYNEKYNKLELYTVKLEKPKENLTNYTKIHKNPPYCLPCHTAYTKRGDKFIDNGENRLRYIWDNYFMWPGYYGSHNGILIGNETEGYKDFLKNSETNKIYNKIPKDYITSKLFMESVAKDELFSIGIRYILADLGGVMFKLQQKIVINDILKNMEKYKYAIVGAVGCPDIDFSIPSFIPESIKVKYNFPDYNAVLDDTINKTNEDFAQRIELIKKWTKPIDLATEFRRAYNFVKDDRAYLYKKGFYKSSEMTALAARLRYVVDTVWEPGILVWTMAPYKNVKEGIIEAKNPNNDYSFAHGRFNFEDLEYWKDLLNKEEDKELLKLLKQDFSEMKILAEELRVKEKQRLNILLQKNIGTKNYKAAKAVIEQKLLELNEQPDIQTIWNYTSFVNPEKYLGDKKYSGYKLSDTRKKFCKVLRDKSISSLSSE